MFKKMNLLMAVFVAVCYMTTPVVAASNTVIYDHTNSAYDDFHEAKARDVLDRYAQFRKKFSTVFPEIKSLAIDSAEKCGLLIEFINNKDNKVFLMDDSQERQVLDALYDYYGWQFLVALRGLSSPAEFLRLKAIFEKMYDPIGQPGSEQSKVTAAAYEFRKLIALFQITNEYIDYRSSQDATYDKKSYRKTNFKDFSTKVNLLYETGLKIGAYQDIVTAHSETRLAHTALTSDEINQLLKPIKQIEDPSTWRSTAWRATKMVSPLVGLALVFAIARYGTPWGQQWAGNQAADAAAQAVGEQGNGIWGQMWRLIFGGQAAFGAQPGQPAAAVPAQPGQPVQAAPVVQPVAVALQVPNPVVPQEGIINGLGGHFAYGATVQLIGSAPALRAALENQLPALALANRVASYAAAVLTRTEAAATAVHDGARATATCLRGTPAWCSGRRRMATQLCTETAAVAQQAAADNLTVACDAVVNNVVAPVGAACARRGRQCAARTAVAQQAAADHLTMARDAVVTAVAPVGAACARRGRQATEMCAATQAVVVDRATAVVGNTQVALSAYAQRGIQACNDVQQQARACNTARRDRCSQVSRNVESAVGTVLTTAQNCGARALAAVDSVVGEKSLLFSPATPAQVVVAMPAAIVGDNDGVPLQALQVAAPTTAPLVAAMAAEGSVAQQPTQTPAGRTSWLNRFYNGVTTVGQRAYGALSDLYNATLDKNPQDDF